MAIGKSWKPIAMEPGIYNISSVEIVEGKQYIAASSLLPAGFPCIIGESY
jgi:hypothetical protein